MKHTTIIGLKREDSYCLELGWAGQKKEMATLETKIFIDNKCVDTVNFIEIKGRAAV